MRFPALIAAICLVCAPARGAEFDLTHGIEAFRAHEYSSALQNLRPAAMAGVTKAQRIVGSILAFDLTGSDERDFGVSLLKAAANSGDTVALIRLEEMRESGAANAPKTEEIAAIEFHRAIELGDASSAWRLTQRVRAHEIATLSATDYIQLLRIAATAKGWPKAGNASFELCNHYSHRSDKDSADQAQQWCALAAKQGHAGAAIALIVSEGNDG